MSSRLVKLYGRLMAMKLNLSIGDMLGNTDRTRDSACPMNSSEHGMIGIMIVSFFRRLLDVFVPADHTACAARSSLIRSLSQTLLID